MTASEVWWLIAAVLAFIAAAVALVPPRRADAVGVRAWRDYAWQAVLGWAAVGALAVGFLVLP